MPVACARRVTPRCSKYQIDDPSPLMLCCASHSYRLVTSHPSSCHQLVARLVPSSIEKEKRPMKGKSFLFSVVLLLLSTAGVAARQPAVEPIHIAATALTPPLFS